MFGWLLVWFSRVRARLAARRLDQDFHAELNAHLDLLTGEHLRQGMARDEARRAAHRRLGGITQLRETHRELRGLPWLETGAQDLRFALRMLRKNPGFTLVAILTLALGIGANVAIFTVINAVLLRPLPYASPRELVTWRGNESQPDVDDIRAQGRIFAAGGAVNEATMDYTGGGEPLGVHAGYVDAGLFTVLGVPAMLGRTLAADEDRRGAARAVVIAYSFWRDHLGMDPEILGKALTLSGLNYTVVGVMPEQFTVPESRLDVYVSLRVVYPEAAEYRGVHFMRSYWRLKPGVTLAQAAAGMAVIDARLAADYPQDEKDRHTIPVPLQQWITGDIKPALWVLFGAVCLVLLIAVSNFAGLLLARGVARRREMVIRSALGGGQGRLVRQTLTESCLLAALGGIAGLLLAYVGVRLLVVARPAALVNLSQISIDPAVLAFTLGVVTLTGFVFGFAPAWSNSRLDAAGALKQEGRTATAGLERHTFRRVLVMGELALALVLLAGAGLLVRGFTRLRAVDPGFDPAHVVTIDMQLPATRYAAIPKQTAFRREVLARLNAITGVQAAMVGDAPLNGGEVAHRIEFAGRPPVAPGDEPRVDTSCVMGDYFRVMGIPLRAGRVFTELDREQQPLVAIINQALAREYFAGQDPIGQRIRWARDDGPRWMTIVGVVADVKQYSLAQPAEPAVYTPFAQSNEDWRRWMSLAIRVPEGAGIIPAVKHEIWSMDSRIPLNRLRSMEELVAVSLSENRFNMVLLSLFAVLAAILAAVGIYGVMSYNVGQRTLEIGIRMAVGARRGAVLKLVLTEAARLTAIGLGIGMAGTLLLTRLMTKLLFHVKPGDPLTLCAAVALMAAVVVVACLVPALRAVKVDPMVALRSD